MSEDDSSSSASSPSSGSESSGAKAKRLKKEKKQTKKDKKKEKKSKKKEKKEAKKLRKKALKELKRQGKQVKHGEKTQDQQVPSEGPGNIDAEIEERPSKRRQRNSSEASMEQERHHKPALKHVEFDWESLLDVCETAARGIKDVNATIQDDQVTVHDSDGRVIEDPEVFKTFQEIREFPRELQSMFRDTGFPSPSQIQAYCWPLGLRHRDIIGIAATGSGKTLAFLLPAFVQMQAERWRSSDGPGLLVMSPTRELASQTESEGNKFGKCLRMPCVAMYGGAPKVSQMAEYRRGCACIVACPGRLNDFLEGRQVQLNNVKTLVLDEADRMLDMGFLPQITKIIEHIPTKRHTLFFTATWPKDVRSLASEILTRPYKVMVGNRDELKGNADVTQLVKIMEESDKVTALHEILMEGGLACQGGLGKALIFCGSKRKCEELNVSLRKMDVPCASIHGDKDQRERERALDDLKQGHIKVLVGTDVAARGLDIKGVGLVVNFDPPGNSEDYVHRIGRTGRAGAKGVAVAFLTPDDANKARNILKVMESTGQAGPLQLHKLAATAGSGKGGGRKGGGKGHDALARLK